MTAHPEGSRRRYGGAIATVALIGAGAVGGAIVAASVTAGAATTTTATPSHPSTLTPPGTRVNCPPPGAGFRPANLQTGTVTKVGATSVTIGSTTYGVTAASDIDKNGEAKLSDLAVGDIVTFSTTTVNGQTVIARLHAGNPALDRPSGPPPGAPDGMGPWGPPGGATA